ncbi:hypothetical protein T492DRAFT_889135 [Pavlovales sp. CCMP2436]|nr:hypothetical protein T492DRAFT_889135 [Pavlovales sp. CCMP2436]
MAHPCRPGQHAHEAAVRQGPLPPRPPVRRPWNVAALLVLALASPPCAALSAVRCPPYGLSAARPAHALARCVRAAPTTHYMVDGPPRRELDLAAWLVDENPSVRRVFDALAYGPLTVAEIAAEVGADVEALARLMRALDSH